MVKGNLSYLLTKKVRIRPEGVMCSQRNKRQREARLWKSSWEEPNGFPGPPGTSKSTLPGFRAAFATTQSSLWCLPPSLLHKSTY